MVGSAANDDRWVNLVTKWVDLTIPYYIIYLLMYIQYAHT